MHEPSFPNPLRRRPSVGCGLMRHHVTELLLAPAFVISAMLNVHAVQAAPAGSEASASERGIRDALPFSDDLYGRWLERHLPLAMRILIIGGGAAALTVGLLVLWTYTLRRQVNLRTRALSDQEAMLRTIIDSIPDLVFIKDCDSVYLAFNRAFAEFCGLSEAELKGKTDFAFASPEEAEFYRQKDREMLASGQPRRNEEWVEYGDGRRVLLDTLKAPYHGPDGQVLGVIGVSRDITAQRRSDELVRDNDILQAVMNGAGDMHLVYLDRDFRFVRVNANYARTCGYTPEEMVGKNHFDLYPHEENHEIFLHVRDAGRPVQVHDKPFVFPDQPERGTTYWDWTLTPVKDKAGVVQGLVFALRETTARRLAEDALLDSQKEAERVARIKADFLSHMSHEIRTPLNGVLGMAQVGLAKSTSELTKETFRTILDSGKVLVGIVDDILDFSKIEAGKLTIEAVPASLREILGHASQLVEENARLRRNSLEIDCAEDVPDNILTDPLRLNQILLNLLSNAIKFTEQGHIRATARRTEDRLILSIADTGIGLTASQIERLFFPFEQAEAGTTRQFGGTGLGLAITRQLVTLLGGTISVHSQPGAGTRFDVSLPLVEAPTKDVAHPGESDAMPARRRRLAGLSILAADDNDVNRLVLDELIHLEGASLTAVSNGALAVATVSARPGAFDLVLMDVQMPEMDGYEATRQIKRLDPDLAVVGLTGFAMTGERDRCLASGMVDHVAKPIDIDRLVPTILKHVKKRAGSGPQPGDRFPAPHDGHAEQREDCSIPRADFAGKHDHRANQTNTCIDWDRLGSRYSGRKEALTNLLETVIAKEGGIPRLLRSAIRAADMELLASVSHSIAGMAGLILAKEVLGCAIKAEMAALAKQADAFEMGTALADSLDATFAEIKTHIQG